MHPSSASLRPRIKMAAGQLVHEAIFESHEMSLRARGWEAIRGKDNVRRRGGRGAWRRVRPSPVAPFHALRDDWLICRTVWTEVRLDRSLAGGRNSQRLGEDRCFAGARSNAIRRLVPTACFDQTQDQTPLSEPQYP